MADKIVQKGTFKRVSNASPGASSGQISNMLNVDVSAIADAIQDNLEKIDVSLKDVAAVIGKLTTYTAEALQENNRAAVNVANHIDSLEKEVRHASTTFQKTMQSLTLNANLPTTSLSVGLPKLYAWALVLSPPIYGVITWAILHLIR